MDSDPTNEAIWLSGLIFLATSGLVLIVGWLARPADRRLLERLGDPGRRSRVPGARSGATRWYARALPTLGARMLPGNVVKRSRFRSRLAHAGIYSSQSESTLLGLKLALSVLPPGLCLAAGMLGAIDGARAL